MIVSWDFIKHMIVILQSQGSKDRRENEQSVSAPVVILSYIHTVPDMKTIQDRASVHKEVQRKEHFFVRELRSGATPVPHFLFGPWRQ